METTGHSKITDKCVKVHVQGNNDSLSPLISRFQQST